MKNLLLVLLLGFAMVSCTEMKKTTAVATSTSTPAPSVDDMTDQGFLAGVIKANSKDSGCPYFIEAREFSYKFDPTNLGNEFKKDGQRVWFKFHALRMQSRCEEATPVEILEMQLMR